MMPPSPPELPPVVQVGSYGLSERPYTWLLHSEKKHSSLVLVTPKMTQPAARRRSTTVASASTALCVNVRGTNPAVCGMPRTAIDSCPAPQAARGGDDERTPSSVSDGPA